MKWKIKSSSKNIKKDTEQEISPLILDILSSRKIINLTSDDHILQAKEFINGIKDFHSPDTIYGMDKAIKRIREAIDKKHKIFIHGDFDADGNGSDEI